MVDLRIVFEECRSQALEMWIPGNSVITLGYLMT